VGDDGGPGCDTAARAASGSRAHVVGLMTTMTSDIEGGGVGGGSISGARRFPLGNGNCDGLATATPARGSGRLATAQGQWRLTAARCSGRRWQRPSNTLAVEGGSSV
jgi:hypothetical protein